MYTKKYESKKIYIVYLTSINKPNTCFATTNNNFQLKQAHTNSNGYFVPKPQF